MLSVYYCFTNKNISHNVYKYTCICNKLPKTLNRPNYYVKLLYIIKMHGREYMYKEKLNNKKSKNRREEGPKSFDGGQGKPK